MPDQATLLVSCPDQPGLVAALAQVLFAHGANILDADQHRDGTLGQFFQRIQFDLNLLELRRASLERDIAEVADRFSMSYRLYYETLPRIAIFVSRYDHCLYDLLLRHRAGEFKCEVPLIVSNHEQLRGVAEQFGIEFRVFEITPQNKCDQELQQFELLKARNIDLVVLARYMQVLSSDFIARFPMQIINIHHSFLPAFVGSKPYHQAASRGVKLIGATAHYATDTLDEGPIIEQSVIRTSHKDSVDDLIRKGRDVERTVLARAVRWHLERRVLVYGTKTVIFE